MITKKRGKMNLDEYTEWTGITCANLKNNQLDNIHMLFGMTTEIGELVDVFKKELAYEKEIDWVNVQEEIGDIMFYIASFCRMNHLDLETIIDKNVRKLSSRYSNKFDSDRAINRDLNKERNILES